jgi:DNA-binding IclR family transcriptional regulator
MEQADQFEQAVQNGDFVKSAARVLAALEFFQLQSRPVHAKELRDALLMAKSSTSQLLQTLVGVGYLTFDPDTKTYLPSFRLVKLGVDYGKTIFDDQLLELMQEVRQELGETVSLLAPDGRNMQFVGTIPGPSYDPKRHMLGFSVPVVDSAAGHAYLATKTDADAIAFLKARLRGWRLERTAAKISEVMELVKTVRRLGVSVSTEPLEPGVSAMATAIDVSPHHVPLIIGIGGASVHQARNNLESLAARFRGIILNYPHCRLYFNPG